MEDVLEVYTRPYDPRFPQLCMDESGKQLVSERVEGLPIQPGQPERYDLQLQTGIHAQPLSGLRAAGQQTGGQGDRAENQQGLGPLHARSD